MAPHTDDAPTHRLRLHPRARAVSRHAEPRSEAARPADGWFYTALVVMLALLAGSQLFTLTHVR
jgi:hypothetical protein